MTVGVRELRPSDLPEVLALMRSALGESPLLRQSEELFTWKHFRNPFGRSIILVAEAGHRIVGVRAFMRWELRTPCGETIFCVRPVDTATHPDFRRMGIFRRLTEAAVEVARSEGVALVFNTPNQASGPGYLKMGWRQVGEIGVLVRPSWRLLTGRKGDGGPLDPTQYLSGSRRVDGSELELKDRPARGLRTPRRPDYLRWRFQQHPSALYLQARAEDGVAVLRPNRRYGRRELLVSDVFGFGTGKAAALREAVRRTRAQYLAAWFSAGSPERRAALEAGLLPVPGVTALRLVCRPLDDLPVDPLALASWDLAFSDLELL